MNGLTKAASDVLAERARQVNAEGWTPEHDDEHYCGQLSAAAAAYASEASDRMGAMMPRAANDIPPHGWPWAEEWWKPSGDLRRDLVKAGALILAEIERLDRAARNGQRYQAGDWNGDAAPGGCECRTCGCIFIGNESRSLCKECALGVGVRQEGRQ